MNSHLESHARLSRSGWLFGSAARTVRSLEAGFAQPQVEVSTPLTDSVGLLSLLQPELLINPQGRKMHWDTTMCSFSPSCLLALASQILPGLCWLALVIFFLKRWNKNPIVRTNSSILLPFLPGSSLRPQNNLEQTCRREELFQTRVAAGLTTPFAPTVPFADRSLNTFLAFLPYHCLQTTLLICLKNLYFADSSFKYIIITALWVKGRVVRSPRDALFVRVRMMQFLDLNSNSAPNYGIQTAVYLLSKRSGAKSGYGAIMMPKWRPLLLSKPLEEAKS